MDTETIYLATTFDVPPQRLYDAWLSSEEHTKMTGAPARIHAEEGGSYWAHDGYAQGLLQTLEPGHRIIQTWRSTDFPPGAADSRVELIFEPDDGGKTRLLLLHSLIPEGQGEGYEKGWEEFYFGPMRAYFGGVRPKAVKQPVVKKKPGKKPAKKKAKAAKKKAARKARKPAAKKAKKKVAKRKAKAARRPARPARQKRR